MYRSTLLHNVLQFRKNITRGSLCSPLRTLVHFNIMYLSLERIFLEVAYLCSPIRTLVPFNIMYLSLERMVLKEASVLQNVLEYTLI